MEGITTLLSAAQSSRLVIFVGAGASMGAPTNLPSWRDVNRVVVRSLATTAAHAIGDDAAANAAELILARHANEKLPPEYQAQLLAEFLDERYFEVLRYIDSDRPNPTHLAIAWLAKLGCVRAIITTNFDRVLESAFAAVGTPLDRHFEPEHFRALAADLARLDTRGGTCQLLKLHGSVDDPGTLIDTLSQRKQGFAPPVLTCVQHLLHTGHWLFLGFSGLDLEAEPNYLALSQEADAAAGFTWLVRENTEPKAAVVKLKQRYGDRGEIVYGDLPGWLLDFTSAVSPEARTWIEQHSDAGTSAAPNSPTSALEIGAKAWAERLSPNVCSMSLAFLVVACAEPQAAAKLVERLLQTIDERWADTSAPTAGALLMKALAANALGILLAGLGRHDEAVHWFTVAVDLAKQAGDDDTRDRFSGNLAGSLETLGRIDEARAMYESALAGYRKRDDPVPLAFGLTSLASHLIRQARFDEAWALAEEAIVHATRAGDERLRGTALNDLGMIAKLKGDYPVALETFADVESLFTRLGNDEAVASAAGNRGEVLAALGQFDEAERIQMEVLEVNERLERLDNQGATCLSLGLLNQRRGDDISAERWFTRALETYRAIKDPSNEAFAVVRLASLRTHTGRLEEAIELAHGALPLVSGRNDAFTANLWNEIGRANLLLGFVGRAEAAYREIIALAEPLETAGGGPVTRSLAGAAQNLGTALLLQQRGDEAAAAFARAADIWQRLGDTNNLEYCRRGETVVRLHEQVLMLASVGRVAAPDSEELREATRQALALYPDIISIYEELGALQLAAGFCVAASGAARFLGENAGALDWLLRAASVFERIGASDDARDALTRAEGLLRDWVNALLRNEQMAPAVPLLLQLAEISGQLGHRESCASATYNAAIGLFTASRYEEARASAERAAELFEPGSNDSLTAQRLAAFCDTELNQTRDASPGFG